MNPNAPIFSFVVNPASPGPAPPTASADATLPALFQHLALPGVASYTSPNVVRPPVPSSTPLTVGNLRILEREGVAALWVVGAAQTGQRKREGLEKWIEGIQQG